MLEIYISGIYEHPNAAWGYNIEEASNILNEGEAPPKGVCNYGLIYCGYGVIQESENLSLLAKYTAIHFENYDVTYCDVAKRCEVLFSKAKEKFRQIAPCFVGKADTKFAHDLCQKALTDEIMRLKYKLQQNALEEKL